jgi:hypothetical protein
VRILALTRNASLLVALGSMMRDWEVVSASDVQTAAANEPGAAVALIDLGPTQEGLTAATELYQSGVTIPCVVLGDELGASPNAVVLVRPFSLEDLAIAVADAAARPADAMPAAPVASGLATANDTAEADNDPSQAHPEVTTMPAEATVAEPPPARVATPAPAEEPRKEPAEARPFTIVRPEDPPRQPARPTPTVSPPPPIERGAEDTRDPEPEPPYVPEPVPESMAPVQAAQPAEPTPVVQRAPQAPFQTVAASASQTAPLPDESAQAGRWRLRRRPPSRDPARAVEESSEPALVGQLRLAARNAAELEMLIEELPFLADLGSLADGLASELEAQFSALVASVYVERADGFHAIAHRGLSRVEAGMIVPATQPLFSDVLQTGEGILIQPVDLAQGLVAGIGGARTEALMGVPAVENGECVAVIIVGHDRFTEIDLDKLTDLANEAAPGLAVALALTRLRERL